MENFLQEFCDLVKSTLVTAWRILKKILSKVFSWKFIVSVIAYSIAVIVLISAYSFYNHEWGKRAYPYERNLGSDYVFHYQYRNSSHSDGYISNRLGKKIVKGADWVTVNEDSRIAVFSKDQRRGYFDYRHGKILVNAAKYTEAYVFSEDRALAMTEDSIYIIGIDGKEIGTAFARVANRNTDINCFHSGCLPMVGDNEKMGIVDDQGNWVVEPYYDYATLAFGKYWVLRNYGDEITIGEAKILDTDLNVIIDQNCSYAWVSAHTGIVLADENHSQTLYGFDGSVKDEFVFETASRLSYYTGEKQWLETDDYDYYSNEHMISHQWQDVEADASCFEYSTSDGYFGLMSAEGKPLTPPLYRYIIALDKDLFKCAYDNNGDFCVLLNAKGERVK